MRQLLALVLCWVTLPIFAGPPPLKHRSQSFTVRLIGENFQGDRGNPASYLIAPPGRIDANTLEIEIQGLEEDRNGKCGEVEQNLSSDLAPATASMGGAEAAIARAKTLKLSIRAESRRLWLKIAGPEVDLLPPSRARQLVESFLQKADVKTFFGCLNLGAVDELILREVDRASARSFMGTLAQEFALSPTGFSLDLRAGMRLCLRSVQTTQRKPPKPVFVGQGNAQCIPIQQSRDPGDGHPTLIFDPLLASFSGIEVQSGDVGPRQVSDAADLSDHARRRRYFKLFYPSAIDRSGYSPAELLNPVYLVGFDTAAERTCSESCDYTGLKAFCGDGSQGDAGCPATCLEDRRAVCYVFQEKTIPLPEILVWLRKEPVWVPVGTTLLDAMDQLGNKFDALPPEIAGIDSQAASCRLLHGLTFQRLFDTRFVDVDFADCGAGALYLPLLPGDQISW